MEINELIWLCDLVNLINKISRSLWTRKPPRFRDSVWYISADPGHGTHLQQATTKNGKIYSPSVKDSDSTYKTTFWRFWQMNLFQCNMRNSCEAILEVLWFPFLLPEICIVCELLLRPSVRKLEFEHHANFIFRLWHASKRAWSCRPNISVFLLFSSLFPSRYLNGRQQ